MNAQIVTVPNILSFFRIVLTPVFITLFMYARGYEWLALFLFTVAMITDIGDGYIARKYGGVSPLGMFLDPIADKVLVCGSLGLCAYLRVLPWWLVWLVLGRDILVTTLRLLVIKDGGVLHTTYFAKVKTVMQFVLLCLVFVCIVEKRFFEQHTLNVAMDMLIQGAMYVVVIATVYSGLFYMKKYSEFKQRIN